MTNEQITALMKELADKGKIIEAGWTSYRYMVVPKNAGAVQVEETRKAFFAGAQHLLSSLMTILDAGVDPTEQDLSRMDSIHNELQGFMDKLQREEESASTDKDSN